MIYPLIIIVGDHTPIPTNTAEVNTKIFAHLFWGEVPMKISKSPKGNSPNMVYAYFETEEKRDNALEIAEKYPFIYMFGDHKRLFFQKCPPIDKNIVPFKSPETAPRFPQRKPKFMTFFEIKLTTKDQIPFPQALSMENTALFANFFGKQTFFVVSQSPFKGDPNVVYASFNNQENFDDAFNNAKANPYITIGGVLRELEVEKSIC